MDELKAFVQILVSIYDFIVGVLKFLYQICTFTRFAIKSVFNLLGNIIQFIFNGEFIDYLGNGYVELSNYMGSYTIIIALLVLATVYMIIFSFIARFVRGKISYKKSK